MANIVYANPGASYVQGQEAGTDNAIRTGMAARQFRAMDLSPEAQAWYLPHIQQQMQLQLQQAGIDVNTAQGKYLSNLLASGDPNAIKLVQEHIKQTTGQDIDFTQHNANGSVNPQTTAWTGNMMTGNVPIPFVNPRVTSSGPHGTSMYVPGEQPQEPYGADWIRPQQGEDPFTYSQRLESYPDMFKRMYNIPSTQQNGQRPSLTGATYAFIGGGNSAQATATGTTNAPAPQTAPAAYGGGGQNANPLIPGMPPMPGLGGAPLPVSAGATGAASGKPPPTGNAISDLHLGVTNFGGPKLAGEVWQGVRATGGVQYAPTPPSEGGAGSQRAIAGAGGGVYA